MLDLVLFNMVESPPTTNWQLIFRTSLHSVKVPHGYRQNAVVLREKLPASRRSHQSGTETENASGERSWT